MVKRRFLCHRRIDRHQPSTRIVCLPRFPPLITAEFFRR